MLSVAAYVALWISLSAGLILLNKYILTTCGFHFPVFLTAYHMLVATIGTNVLRFTTSLLAEVNERPMDLSTWSRSILPLGLLFSGSLVLANYAYLHLSVSFVQMLKASIPVCVNLISAMTGLVKLDSFTSGVLVLIGFGCALAGFGELHYDIIGLVCQLACIIVSTVIWGGAHDKVESLRLVLMQVLLHQQKLGPLASVYYYSPVCLVFLVVLLVIKEGSAPFSALPSVGVPLLLLNGAVAFGLNVAGVFLIGAAGSLVLTLSGILKVEVDGQDVMLITLSVVVLGSSVQSQQVFGYGLAVIGLTAFKYQEQAKQAMKAIMAGSAMSQKRFNLFVAGGVMLVGVSTLTSMQWRNPSLPVGTALSLSSQISWPPSPMAWQTSRRFDRSSAVSVLLVVTGDGIDLYKPLRSALLGTVGPYELLFDANNVTHTQGLSILAAVRQHVSHEKGSAGLVGLKAIVSSQNEAVTAHGWPALAKQASFDHIAILDTSDQYLDFGWDRLLLNAHLSNPHAFALSGRAAANLKMGNQYGPETDDVVGIFQKLSEEGKSVQELLHVRDVSFASPIMFVKDTLLSVSAKISEQWTLRPEVPVGFLFMLCLLARSEHAQFCGFVSGVAYMEGEHGEAPSLLEKNDSMELAQWDRLHDLMASRPEKGHAVSPISGGHPARTIATMVVYGLHRHLVPLAESLQKHHARPHDMIVFVFDGDDVVHDLDDSIRKLFPDADIRHLSSPHIDAHQKSFEQMVRTGLALKELIRNAAGSVLWIEPSAGAPQDLTHVWRNIAHQGIWATRTDFPFHLAPAPLLLEAGLHPGNIDGAVCKASMFGFNTLDTRAVDAVLEPFANCASDVHCVSRLAATPKPDVQTLQASYLSALMVRSGYPCSW